ncbi:hypothetical protein HON71_04725 [Candidatus Woesearchaeota archaeon]|jgi:hypothetical protein|nr:hypothetical protein [Candidatus Woesearchaeota archaeon]
MNKIKRALTGAAVLGSLVLGGNALADERPKVNAHNCPAGQEIYVDGHNDNNEEVQIVVGCKPSGKSKTRVRCVTQFDGNGDCKNPAEAEALGIPADAYVTNLCPTKQLCYDSSQAGYQAATVEDVIKVAEPAVLAEPVKEDVQVMDLTKNEDLTDIVNNEDSESTARDVNAELDSLNNGVGKLYEDVGAVEDYVKDVEEKINGLLGEESQFALNKMKESCKDQYAGMQTRITALETANEKLKTAEYALADHLSPSSCEVESNELESREEVKKTTPSEALRTTLNAEKSTVNVNEVNVLLNNVKTAADAAKVKADELLTYKTFVTDHPCGYEEPREVRVNLGASGVWMGTEQRLDGDFSVGVHAPVGKKSYLGLEVAASGLEAKSESKAYGSGDIQNGTESSDLRRLASGHGVASVNLGVFRPYAMVGVALVDESRKNSYEVFGQDKSIEDNGLEATIDAGVGFSVGKDIRLKVGEFYNSKMGPRTTVGLELEF